MAMEVERLQNGAGPAAAAQLRDPDRAQVMGAFREAVERGGEPADVALSALRDGLHVSGSGPDLKLSAEQNQLLENALRLLLQEYVVAAASAEVPVLHFGAPDTSLRHHSSADRRPLFDANALPDSSDMEVVNSADAPGEAGLALQSTGGDVSASAGQAVPAVIPQGVVVRLLDAALWLCEAGHIEGGIALQLLEDLLDESDIKDCKAVFGYLESKQHVLRQEHILQRGKLILLRTCNQLVRRLSKANDLVFCGRILILLAFLFPIAEKSAVNIKGAFNTANKTAYSTVPPTADASSTSGGGAPTAAPAAFDFAFYTTFWSLQEFCSNPPSASTKWGACSEALKAVLAAFAAQPLADGGVADSAAVAGDLGSFNVKYLTSPNLLGLEMKDHNFRRHILLQCLFLLDYLSLAPGPASGKQDRAREKDREEKRAAMLGEVRQLQGQARRLLRTIPPGADSFLHTVDRVLSREQNWISWKKEGCPPFDRPPANLSAPAAAPPPASGPQGRGGRGGRGTRRGQEKKDFLLGNPELDELFSWAARHPNVLTDPDSVEVPKFRDFVSPLAEDMDPGNGVEDEMHRKHDRVFAWRALRLASRQDIDAFNRFDPVVGVEMVVPPDMLVDTVRVKLHKKAGPSLAAAGRPKKEPSPAPPASSAVPTPAPVPAQAQAEPPSAEAKGLPAPAEPQSQADDGGEGDRGPTKKRPRSEEGTEAP